MLIISNWYHKLLVSELSNFGDGVDLLLLLSLMLNLIVGARHY